jgi:hypothetical protein
MADADGQIVLGSQEGRAPDGSSGVRTLGFRIRRIPVDGWLLRLVDPVSARIGPTSQEYAFKARQTSVRDVRIRPSDNYQRMLCRLFARASATCAEFHT